MTEKAYMLIGGEGSTTTFDRLDGCEGSWFLLKARAKMVVGDQVIVGPCEGQVRGGKPVVVKGSRRKRLRWGR